MNEILFKLQQIGERLREQRVSKLLNQEDFARIGGVKRVSQSSYENGKSPFGVDYLLKLKALDIDIGYIVTGIRQDGSLGAMEQMLIDAFRSLGEDDKSIFFNMLNRMAGLETDLQSLPRGNRRFSQHQTIHESTLEYRAQPRDDAL